MNNIEDSKVLSFLGSPAKHGKSYVFTIPNIFIKANEIDLNMIYKISIKPIKVKPQKKI